MTISALLRSKSVGVLASITPADNMADPNLLISDLLCYSIKKFARVAHKPLKAVLCDFYNSDEISAAKDLLISEIDKACVDKLKEDPTMQRWTKPARRRKDSVNRSSLEIEDILQSILYADGAKILDKLPVFVSTDPDRMPSIKLTDGDLALVLLKLTKIEERQEGICSKLSTVVRNVDLQKSSLHSGHFPSLHTKQFVTVPEASNITSASDIAENSDFDGELLTQRRKRKKPVTPTFASVVASNMPCGPITKSVSGSAAAPRGNQRKTWIGASSSANLKASKNIIVKKAVFFLGNIDSTYTIDNVSVYIKSLGIRLLSCFQLPKNDNYPEDNRSFRICIVDEDKSKLCNCDNWALGVSLREWKFKPKITDDPTRKVADNSSQSAMEDCNDASSVLLVAGSSDSYVNV